MLWQLLTGQLPFRVQRPVTAAQLPALLQTRCNRLPAPPPSCLISPVAQAIVQHCVEFRPEDRYQTAYQLGVDLKRALERQPLHYARLSVPDHPSRTIEPGEGI
jgi:serine/threonine protein kinase